MELGNLLFGNSRGEFPVNREWQDDFYEFLEKCNIDGYGYYEGENEYETESGGFENEIFLINPYDWNAYCTCGFEERNDEWWNKNKHDQNCFFVKRKKFEEELRNLKIEYFSDLYIKLLDEFAKSNGYTGWEGSGVYCDCGLHSRYDEWCMENGHSTDCRLIQPNFLYKPTGFQINWYKYPLRDSYMNMDISFEELKKIMEHCIESIKSKEMN